MLARPVLQPGGSTGATEPASGEGPKRQPKESTMTSLDEAPAPEAPTTDEPRRWRDSRLMRSWGWIAVVLLALFPFPWIW
jgi:hypothetical protein